MTDRARIHDVLKSYCTSRVPPALISELAALEPGNGELSMQIESILTGYWSPGAIKVITQKLIEVMCTKLEPNPETSMTLEERIQSTITQNTFPVGVGIGLAGAIKGVVTEFAKNQVSVLVEKLARAALTIGDYQKSDKQLREALDDQGKDICDLRDQNVTLKSVVAASETTIKDQTERNGELHAMNDRQAARLTKCHTEYADSEAKLLEKNERKETTIKDQATELAGLRKRRANKIDVVEATLSEQVGAANRNRAVASTIVDTLGIGDEDRYIELEQRNENLEDTAAKWKLEAEGYREERDTVRGKREELKIEIDRIATLSSDRWENICNLEKANQSRGRQVAELQSNNRLLLTKISEQSAAHRALFESNRGMIANADKLHVELAASVKKANNLDKLAIARREDLERTSSNLADARHTIGDLQVNYSRAVDDRRRALDSLDASTGKLEERRKEIERLKVELNALNCGQVGDALDGAKRTIDQQVADIRGLKETVATHWKDLVASQRLIGRRNEEHRRDEIQIEYLGEQIANLKNTARTAGGAHVKELQKQVNHLVGYVRELKQTITEITQDFDDLEIDVSGHSDWDRAEGTPLADIIAAKKNMAKIAKIYGTEMPAADFKHGARRFPTKEEAENWALDPAREGEDKTATYLNKGTVEIDPAVFDYYGKELIEALNSPKFPKGSQRGGLVGKECKHVFTGGQLFGGTLSSKPVDSVKDVYINGKRMEPCTRTTTILTKEYEDLKARAIDTSMGEVEIITVTEMQRIRDKVARLIKERGNLEQAVVDLAKKTN